jgi:hypothetical protein
MSQGWENHEPAPLEFFHSELMKQFHDWRRSVNGEKTTNESAFIQIDGIKLGNLIATAKIKTYEKYKHMKLQEPVLKKDIIVSEGKGNHETKREE